MLILLAVLLAFFLAYAVGSDPRTMRLADLRLAVFAPIGLGLQLLGPRAVGESEAAAVLVWLAGAVLLAGVALANLRHLGSGLIAAGVALNTFVIIANGGMPVSSDALAALGITDVAAVFDAASPLHHLADDETIAYVLGDVLPVAGPPPFRSVGSLGDMLFLVGLVVIVLEMAEPRASMLSDLNKRDA